jgi:hypothetical protein
MMINDYDSTPKARRQVVAQQLRTPVLPVQGTKVGHDVFGKDDSTLQGGGGGGGQGGGFDMKQAMQLYDGAKSFGGEGGGMESISKFFGGTPAAPQSTEASLGTDWGSKSFASEPTTWWDSLSNGFGGSGGAEAGSSGGFMDSIGSMFSGGGGAAAGSEGGASAAAGSNPYGWIAAALLSANVAHNKGVSPWSETLKGQGPGNYVDYYQGDQDGKQHGFMSKVLDKDGATGQATKGYTDLMTGDFSNSFKHNKQAVKDIFKLKFF